MLVKVEAYHDGGFWCARGIGEDIFTQGKTFGELCTSRMTCQMCYYYQK
jgi:hypothetical protein